MSQTNLLKRHRYILSMLAKASNKNRKIILMNAPAELFKALAIIFRIIDENDIKITASKKKILKKHQSLIRSTRGIKSPGAIKTHLSQKGGALGAILSTVLPIFGGLLKKLF